MLAVALFLGGIRAPTSMSFAGKAQEWRVPIVMEKATIRGKVVILETRREERASIKNLTVEVWTRAEETEQKKSDPRKERLHATKTDEAGFFSLPLLDVGEYLLVLGELELQLSVIPQAEQRKGQEEPKVLLLLLPREVLQK